MPDLRIASRASALALAQARLVATLLADSVSGLEVDIVEIATSGDLDRNSLVTSLTEMGAFVRAVQRAVLDGRADVAVHSCKDLPVTGPEGLGQWYPAREAPWDVLCGASLDELRNGALVGTGSPRRAAQLSLLRPDLEIVPIRGNVPTRLGKVGGEVDAVVLAEAGLRRLDLASQIDHRFELHEMVPAPAQAAICAEARLGSEWAGLLERIDDSRVRTVIDAERLLLAKTGAGCRSALGALVHSADEDLTMTAFVADEDGPRRVTVSAASASEVADAAQRGLGL